MKVLCFPTSDDVVRRGDNYFCPLSIFAKDDTYPHLDVRQSHWTGPFPSSEEPLQWLGGQYSGAKSAVKRLDQKGVHLHVQIVGAYLHVRRLAERAVGPLAAWHQLPAEVPMLLHPMPSTDRTPV